MVKGMLVYVPEDLYRKFKSKLAERGQSIKGVIISFLQIYCEDEDLENGHKSNSNENKKG